jgi:hypothetical protein
MENTSPRKSLFSSTVVSAYTCVQNSLQKSNFSVNSDSGFGPVCFSSACTHTHTISQRDYNDSTH